MKSVSRGGFECNEDESAEGSIDKKVDSTANLDRLLRPVGSLRKSGNRARVFLTSKNRYTLSDFRLQPTEPEKPAYVPTRCDGESPIEKYLQSVGWNSPEAILQRQGYTHVHDGFWIRPGSQSGQPTGEVYIANGQRGFTVKSGAADPLTNMNENGTSGRWYSCAALYVAFDHQNDWKKAAKFCYEQLESTLPTVDHSKIVPDTKEVQPTNKKEQPTTTTATTTSNERSIAPKMYFMNTVQPEKIVWFWENRIPRGNLSILAGIGGLGKSTAVCDIIGKVTTGRPLPGETAPRSPERVLLLNCEDDPATVIRPRLDAAGADASMVANIEGFQRGDEIHWVDFDIHSPNFEDVIRDGNFTFLVVDPISGHMGGTKQNDTAQVRAVMQKLQAVAKNTGCTILVLTHSPKAAPNVQSAFIGSQAFLSCARAGFVVLKDPDDQDRVLFLSAKSNYSPEKTGLAYRFENVDGVGRVVWDEQAVNTDPNSYFVQQSTGTGQDSQKCEQASQKLCEFLSEPKSVKEVNAWAQAEGITQATLRRAREHNGHRSEKRGTAWFWLPMDGSNLWNPNAVIQGVQ